MEKVVKRPSEETKAEYRKNLLVKCYKTNVNKIIAFLNDISYLGNSNISEKEIRAILNYSSGIRNIASIDIEEARNCIQNSKIYYDKWLKTVNNEIAESVIEKLLEDFSLELA